MNDTQQIQKQEETQDEILDEIIPQNQEEKKSLPWHPLKGETFKEYNAFERYLSLGPGRSVSQTATALKLHRTTLAQYAKKWNWEQRALLHYKVHYELRRNDALLESEQHRGLIRNLRSDVAQYSYIASCEIAKLLKDFWSTYDNPLFMKKINFMFHISRTLDKLMHLAEIPIDEHALNDRSIRDININNLLNLNGDLEQISDEAYFAYKNHMNEVEGLRISSHPDNYKIHHNFNSEPFHPPLNLNKTLDEDNNITDKSDNNENLEKNVGNV